MDTPERYASADLRSAGRGQRTRRPAKNKYPATVGSVPLPTGGGGAGTTETTKSKFGRAPANPAAASGSRSSKGKPANIASEFQDTDNEESADVTNQPTRRKFLKILNKLIH